MRPFATLALILALGIAPSPAQEAAAPREEEGSIELLELEQEVDKSLLREALLLQGQRAMKPRTTAIQNDPAELKIFIADKKEVISRRAAELKKLRVEANRPRPMINAFPARPPAASEDLRDLAEKREEAQVEVLLLQKKVELYQATFNEALDALAAAEVAAARDESEEPKAEAARKVFEKVKANAIDFGQRLQVQQARLGRFQQELNMRGMGGMGGGMGGMGGFR